MSDFLTIVRAVYSGLSQRKVAATHGVSRNTVSLYLRKARDQGWLTLKNLDAVDNTAVAQSLQQFAAPSVFCTTHAVPVLRVATLPRPRQYTKT